MSVASGMAGLCEQDGPAHGRGGVCGTVAFHGLGWTRSKFGNKSASRWWTTDRTWLPQPARGAPLDSARTGPLQATGAG